MANIDKLIANQDWFSLSMLADKGIYIPDKKLSNMLFDDNISKDSIFLHLLNSMPLSPKIIEILIIKDFNLIDIILNQKIPENLFIKYDKVFRCYIRELLISQTLSEEYIEDNLALIKSHILILELVRYQKLSESFIKKHETYFSSTIIMGMLISYQLLSKEYITYLINKYNPKVCDDFDFIDINIETDLDPYWQYKSADERLEIIKKSGLYEIEGDYVLAYKSIRKNGYSKFNFQYKYEVGLYYTSKADYNTLNNASYGFSSWTLKHVLTKYYNWHENKIIKIKIHKSEIAALVHNDTKIRSTALYAIKEIKYPILLYIFNSIINIFKRKKW